MVRGCGYTCQTIREVDGLSPSTLLFSGKSTPSVTHWSCWLPGMLPWPAGGTPSQGVAGGSLKFLKTCAGWSKKLPIPLTSLSHCMKKCSKKFPQLPSRVAPFGAGVPKTAHFDHFLLQKRNFYLLHLHQTIVLLRTLRPCVV